MLCIVALCLNGLPSMAQKFHVGLFGGASAYSGDLVDRIFPKKQTYAVLGITGNYELSDHFMLRTGFTMTHISGADRLSNDTVLVKRNLSFDSRIWEASLMGEFYLLDLNTSRLSPYIFAGLALYHFNPYTFDQNEVKVFLKPLSTEGEGLAGYPNSQPYSLIQMAIPLGGGFKFAINENVRVGLEAGIRKLFTDYLDDLSTAYADPADLLASRGQQSVDLSYRGDEVAGGDPLYPAKGAQRGGATNRDYYYFAGMHLTFRLGGETPETRSLPGKRGHKSRLGCPANIY